MAPPPDPPKVMEFGRFRAGFVRRELLVEGRAVELGDHAFDKLLALLGAPALP